MTVFFDNNFWRYFSTNYISFFRQHFLTSFFDKIFVEKSRLKMVSNFTDENCWRKKLSNHNSTTVFFDNIFRHKTTAFDKIFKIFCQNLSKNAVYDSFFRQYISTTIFAKNFRQQFSTTVFFDNKFRQQFSHRMVFMSKKIVELKFDSLFRQHFSH